MSINLSATKVCVCSPYMYLMLTPQCIYRPTRQDTNMLLNICQVHSIIFQRCSLWFPQVTQVQTLNNISVGIDKYPSVLFFLSVGVEACLGYGGLMSEEGFEIQGDAANGSKHGGPERARKWEGKPLMEKYELCTYNSEPGIMEKGWYRKGSYMIDLELNVCIENYIA